MKIDCSYWHLLFAILSHINVICHLKFHSYISLMCIKLFRYKCIYIKLCSPCMLWKKKKKTTLLSLSLLLLLEENIMFIYSKLVSSLIFNHILMLINAQEKMFWLCDCNCQIWGGARGETARINRFLARCIRELEVLVQASLRYLGRDVYCICTGMFPRVHETVPAVLSFETWNFKF